MNAIVEILLWIWQAPQNIVGLVFRIIYPGRSALFCGVDVVVHERFPGGISLGRTIIVKHTYWENPNEWKHEYGHTRQSLYLGPLYLLIVGIPSSLWAVWYRIHKRGSYFSFFTEKWADKLGGVVRPKN